MKSNVFKTLILFLSVVVLAGGMSSCKSKKKIAEEQAAAAYAAKVDKAKKDLLQIINDGNMPVEDKERRLNVIKEQNFDDTEIQDLIVQAEAVVAKEKAEAKKLQIEMEKKAEQERKEAMYANINAHFEAVAASGDYDIAGDRIKKAMSLFASEDVPVLIIIARVGDKFDYDRPTTIKNYLQYLKDQQKYDKRVYNAVYNPYGKITELELIK